MALEDGGTIDVGARGWWHYRVVALEELRVL